MNYALNYNCKQVGKQLKREVYTCSKEIELTHTDHSKILRIFQLQT